MSIKASTTEAFVDYSQFNHVEEFREHVTLWMVEYKSNFTRNEQIALQRLILFAEKVPGVCNAKIGNMLKSIYEDRGELGMISRSSFKRMLQKAIKFGIKTVYETVRNYGSCLVIFMLLIAIHLTY